jgi:hypothetical protein
MKTSVARQGGAWPAGRVLRGPETGTADGRVRLGEGWVVRTRCQSNTDGRTPGPPAAGRSICAAVHAGPASAAVECGHASLDDERTPANASSVDDGAVPACTKIRVRACVKVGARSDREISEHVTVVDLVPHVPTYMAGRACM